MKNRLFRLLWCALMLLLSASFVRNEVPTIFIIGDSTVKNGKVANGQLQVGWGELLTHYFDSTKIKIDNEAIPGRSSRTYINEGHWDDVLSKMKKGDILVLQFGHNDPGNIADSAKPRGSLKGISNDSTLVYNHLLKIQEYVHTYGWYLDKIVSEAKAKSVVPIIVTPIPRHIFTNNKTVRADKDYGLWAKQIAEKEAIAYIDLNSNVANVYDRLGFDSTATFFPKDHTHTNLKGAEINASEIVTAIQQQKNLQFLRKFLINND